METSNSDTTSNVFADFARLLEKLPNYQEREELIILKGHLLIEELIRAYIERCLPNKAAFDHAFFTFSRCLMIAEALTKPSEFSWVFKAVIKLNALRNDIAHNIDSEKYSAHMKDFLATVEASEPNRAVPVSERSESRLYLAVAQLFHSTSDLLHGAAKAN